MTPATLAKPILDATQAQKVSYCIPLWLRDEQIRLNTSRVPGRLSPSQTLHDEPIAIVCFGPSLNETWEKIRQFKYVMSCSGSHKFLIERGIIPTWHCDVDPREHKIQLIGDPHHDVQYVLASTCHPSYFEMLMAGGFNVKLWHVFDGADEALRVLPPGEWALTGGCSVGLRALHLARFLGFRELDVFGMDGNEGKTGKHAAAHPNQAPGANEVTFDGVTYQTTPAFLEAARSTAHEMDDLKDVTARFHGDGLVQSMMRSYKRTSKEAPTIIAFNKPELISEEYRSLNQRLHSDNLAYGVGGGKYAKDITKIVETIKATSVLDYGCGKGYLAKALPFPIWEYDPAVPGKDESPRPADVVICSDVLEHIEPAYLPFVLDDLRRCVKQVGYFVIGTGAAQKVLADGRNAHLIQKDATWWTTTLTTYFKIGKIDQLAKNVCRFIVGPHPVVAKKPGGVLQAVTSISKFDFARVEWKDDPYRIGSASDVLRSDVYTALTMSFPALELFWTFGEGNIKFSLSSVNNQKEYEKFLRQTPVWMAFYQYIKSDGFIEQMRQLVPLPPKVKARFEFSLLPADGGCLRPHRDIPSKLVTVIVGMPTPGTLWTPAWGGGTDVYRPHATGESLDDYKADWSAFDLAHTYPYRANTAVVFIKTADSWHGVSPMVGPAGAMRRTVTINIEKRI